MLCEFAYCDVCIFHVYSMEFCRGDGTGEGIRTATGSSVHAVPQLETVSSATTTATEVTAMMSRMPTKSTSPMSEILKIGEELIYGPMGSNQASRIMLSCMRHWQKKHEEQGPFRHSRVIQ